MSRIQLTVNQNHVPHDLLDIFCIQNDKDMAFQHRNKPHQFDTTKWTVTVTQGCPVGDPITSLDPFCKKRNSKYVFHCLKLKDNLAHISIAHLRITILLPTPPPPPISISVPVDFSPPLNVTPLHGCQMAIAIFLDRMCLALWASGIWLRYATLQNLIPSFPWIAPPRPPPWRNPRKGGDQILQRSVVEP